MQKSKISFVWFLVIQLGIIIMSLSGVLQKFAAFYAPFSFMFIFLYFCSVVVLFIYALLWQIILKRVPLIVAYSNRAFSAIWALIWGVLFFHETIRWNQIVGALIICAGVFLVTTGGMDNEQ